ncbi:hypothetical protein C8F01DRAFT_1300367 [Mycena amicta]|nr:hypothetical protein C8F01DRAFT_1300367 [Mycena amicta]
MENPAQLPPFDASNTIGALQIGVILSSVLFGMTTLQVYVYFERFPKDRLSIKPLVVFVWLVETAHAACFSHVLYSYSIINYGNPASLLLKPPVTFDIGILLSGFIVVSVQLFFAYRIYILSKNRPVAICFAFLAVYLNKWGTVAILVLSLSAATDLAIALTLVILLRKDREKRFQKTNVIINQLITWTIETGLLTSVSGIATAVAYQTMKTNLIWLALFAIRSRLFANSFLAGLNSRTALRAARQNQTHTSTFPSHPSSFPVSATLGGDAYGHPQIEMTITKTTKVSDTL